MYPAERYEGLIDRNRWVARRGDQVLLNLIRKWVGEIDRLLPTVGNRQVSECYIAVTGDEMRQ